LSVSTRVTIIKIGSSQRWVAVELSD
jgi:hypothetical protein